MSAVAILLIIAIFLLAAAMVYIWWLHDEIQRLTEARHADSRPRGDQPPARPGTTLVGDREAAGHADAMHRLSEPFLPSGQHAQSWPRLTERTVPVVQTDDSAPWETRTAAQPVLDGAYEEHVRFVRSQLPEHEEDAKQEDFDQAMALLRERTAAELPPEPMYEPTNEQTRELYFDGAPQLEVAPELAKRVAS